MTLDEDSEIKKVLHRGYEIFREAKGEYRIIVAANSLKEAKQIIDWMIHRGCLEVDEETED